MSLLLLTVVNLASAEDKKYSKRFGKLLLTITAIDTPKALRKFGVEGEIIRPHADYRFILVRVRVKNVSGSRGVREWLQPLLRTTIGLEYGPTIRFSGPGPYQPEVYELRPGEVTEGLYVFEVKEGGEPDRITFKRPYDNTKIVHISLKGFQNRATSSADEEAPKPD
jgi:hypothetical protein